MCDQGKRIRVGLLTLSHFPRMGGAEYANHYLASELNKNQNIHLSVACRNMPEVKRSYPYGYPVYQAPPFMFYERKIRELTRHFMVRKEKVNVLFGSAIHTGGAYAVQLKKRYNLPAFVQAHGSDVLTIPEINYGVCLNPDIKKLVQKTLTEADHVFAVSHRVKDAIAALGTDPEKISIIHNGIHYGEIQKIPYQDIRKKYGLKETDFILVTSGRNTPVKRLELVKDAMQILIRSYKDIKWMVIGPPPDFKAEVEHSSLSGNVVFTGIIQGDKNQPSAPFANLINHYRAANLYISSSYSESFGMAALEAMTCGIPALVSPRNGITDIIKTDINGFIFRNETACGLATEIMRIYEQRTHIASLKNKIISSTEAYSWENIAKQYIRHFETSINH